MIFCLISNGEESEKSCLLLQNNLYLLMNIKRNIMVIVTHSEFNANPNKYFALASEDTVLIQGEDSKNYVLRESIYSQPDEDLERAITLDELWSGVQEDIRNAYKRRHKE
jgi:hypothetical protein